MLALTPTPRQDPRTGVAELLDVARLDPETFVGYLAEARIPAGVELREADRPRIGAKRVQLGRGGTAGIKDIIAVFNTRHPDYRAELSDGVVTIRPTSNRSAYFDQRMAGAPIQVRGLLSALRKVFAPIDPTLDAGGGHVGSLLGDPNLDRGEAIEIRIDPQGRTVASVLASIARSAPGHAWLVITRADKPVAITQIGLVHSNGTTTELPVNQRRSGAR